MERERRSVRARSRDRGQRGIRSSQGSAPKEQRRCSCVRSTARACKTAGLEAFRPEACRAAADCNASHQGDIPTSDDGARSGNKQTAEACRRSAEGRKPEDALHVGCEAEGACRSPRIAGRRTGQSGGEFATPYERKAEGIIRNRAPRRRLAA